METLKMLLGIKDNSQDGLLSFIISDVENLIMSYCKIDSIPTKLEALIPVMAADMYRRKGYGRSEAPQKIQSVTEDKRSVSFEVQKQNSEVEDFLLEYEARLKPFKNKKGAVPSEL